MCRSPILLWVLPVARVPASDPYLFASGEHRVAGGDKIKATRREASGWTLSEYFLSRFYPGFVFFE